MAERGELDRLVSAADDARLTMRTSDRAELVRTTQARARELLATADAAARADDLDRAIAVLCGFFVPLVESEHTAEAQAQLAALLTRSTESKDPERRFQLHEVACVEAFLRGEESADDHCRELFTIAAHTSSDDLLARALTARCRLGLRHNDAASVESDAAELAEIAERLGDNFHAAFAPHMLANLREMQDRPTEAIEHYNESSRLFAEAGADNLLLTEEFNLAACHLDLGQHRAARDRFVSTYRLMRQLENHHIEPELLSCLAALLAGEGDSDTAAQLVGASEAAQRRHDRALYPAEAQAAVRTRLRVEETLGRERFLEQHGKGLAFTFGEAANLAMPGDLEN